MYGINEQIVELLENNRDLFDGRSKVGKCVLIVLN